LIEGTFRMGHKMALLVLCLTTLMAGGVQAGFWDVFDVTYGVQNVQPFDSNGTVAMSLTADGVGPTFATWNTYLFGQFKCEIKLVPGNSAGTVAAIFLSSGAASVTDGTHDEIDFEFLGNVSGQPYKMQTNIFANGTGGREEQMFLWFDPTEDFHTYEVIWNHQLVMWKIDSIPVRVYKNIENQVPLSFPNFRPMTVTTCIFDASQWATQGGAVKIDYSAAPFTVTYQNWDFSNACVAQGDNVGTCADNYSNNWWESAAMTDFNSDWQNQMDWVRQNFLQYEYCKDPVRYTPPPPECQTDFAL
jgi:beta-glucanase (GH16 family)